MGDDATAFLIVTTATIVLVAALVCILAIMTSASPPKMERRQAGSSGLTLSVLGMGTWQFGSAGTDDYWGLEFTDDLAKQLTARASALGVTYFDTAEDYAKGGSERQLGRAIAALKGAEVVIGSKILPNHCTDVRTYAEGTLSRLGVNCIDLYMVHWPIDANSMAHFAGTHTASGGRDYSTTGAIAKANVPPVEKAFTELMKLQQEGKIKHVGVSNFGVKQLEEALKTGVKLACNQLCYNLIFRAAEMEIIPFCAQHGIGVLAYSPLMQGLLTNAAWASSADTVPSYRARTRHFDGKRPKSRHGEAGHEELLVATLHKLRGISTECGIPLADLALAFPLANPAVTSVIAGATKMSQLEANERAARIKLSPPLLAKLLDATEELKAAMGSNCDLWQGLHTDGKFDGRIK